MCQTGWFLLRVREVAAAHWCFNDPYVQVEANPIRVILGTAEKAQMCYSMRTAGHTRVVYLLADESQDRRHP
jgi:hypothetical protein